jgi:hypothetical protein
VAVEISNLNDQVAQTSIHRKQNSLGFKYWNRADIIMEAHAWDKWKIIFFLLKLIKNGMGHES